MTITCPCCGGSGQIEEQAPVPLTPLQFKIYDAVRRSKHGLGSRALIDRVYADRIDGGPDNPINTICQTIKNMNARLAVVGQRVHGTTRGVGSVYRLQRTN
jgi:hypothetical protein